MAQGVLNIKVKSILNFPKARGDVKSEAVHQREFNMLKIADLLEIPLQFMSR